jgi:hypothetical protein
MTAAHRRTTTLQPAAARSSPIVDIGVSAATIVIVVVLAIVPLLTPLFIHPALDAAGSADQLGLDAASTHAASDRSVADLLSPAGTFDFAGPSGSPFLDPAERAHLADTRTLLWLAFVAGAVCAVAVGLAIGRRSGGGRRARWRAVSRGGAVAAIGAIVVGVVGAVAFGSLFTLFHEIAFPGGDWAFDPTTQRLVQLYPLAFWQIAAAAWGLLVVVLGSAAWWLGRRASRARPGTEPATP